jgi:purine-nucleoside/S-methyl-5'-thioadenosine phosphorylase / adenosine deaminase
VRAIAAGVIDPQSPGGHPASWVATGRFGGVSEGPYASLNLAAHVGDDPAAVRANRDRVAEHLGARPGDWAVMEAVHGAGVAEVSEPGSVPEVDALVTRTPGLVLIALAADCVPLVLVGDDDQTVAAVHCGWRGLVADVVGATAEVMARSDARITRAVLGPAVCGQCYPVPHARAAEVQAACSPEVAAAALVTCADGQPGIDVRSALVARLAELGVHDTGVVGGCTVEHPDLFSYRRDGRTGRQGIAVVRHERMSA